jgi:glutamate-1-semialdehyde 2,1-aminomutase
VDQSSLEFRSRLDKSIAQGCLTNSKHPSCFVDGVYPTGIKAGRACFVEGTDGRNYFDTINGLGSVSVGYRNTNIDRAVLKQIIDNGVSFSLPSLPEIQAAELLLSDFLPQYDAVKWLKTGAEATSAAVRIARAATGRKKVIQVGYHGWHDQWISTKASPLGLGDQHEMVECAKIEDAINLLSTEFAAIIVEPIMLEHSIANTTLLKSLKAACEKVGTLLIFDEIVCGMRIPECFISSEVHADLVCVGKGIANGWPLSGVVGKKHLMHDIPYFVSSTFGGETVSLVAARETLTYWRKNDFMNVWEKAQHTMKYINFLLEKFHVKLEGYGTRGFWQAKDMDSLGLVFQEACSAQVLLGRSFFYNFASREMDDTLRSRLEDAAMKLSRSDCKLKGKAPKEPFKRI